MYAATMASHSRQPERVLGRSVVLPELRVLYTPTPKAACTSTLWLLAELAGYSRDDFVASKRPTVEPDSQIQDARMWRRHHRFSHYSPAEQDQIWTSPDWFRFTVVREPVGRFWSAWTNKLLLRQPIFVKLYERLGLIPAIPTSPQELRGAFLEFVAAVHADPSTNYDPHWAPQSDRIGDLPYTHVGRIESMSETLDALSGHIARPLPAQRRANATPLRFTPALLDDQSRRALNELLHEDQERFGYAPVQTPADAQTQLAAWEAQVAPVLPMIGLVVERHERIAQLVRTFRPNNNEC